MLSKRTRGDVLEKSIKIRTMILFVLIVSVCLSLMKAGAYLTERKRIDRIHKRAEAQVAEYRLKKQRGEWSNSSFVDGVINYSLEIIKIAYKP